MTLTGRRILVAGGAAGIGLATATLARAAGATVTILDRNPAADLQADVRDSTAINAAMAAAAERMGGLDGIVYCAGTDSLMKLADTSDEVWQTVLDVNLTGAMRVCRAGLRHFAPEGGSIVLVASGAGLRPLADRTAYCASKAGLVMLAKTMALELAPRDIRVNAVCPGAVETGMFRGGFAGVENVEQAVALVRERYALRRIAEPDEIARCILFLTSADSSYVTGTAMAADGGRTFH